MATLNGSVFGIMRPVCSVMLTFVNDSFAQHMLDTLFIIFH